MSMHVPLNESKRLKALQELEILDTEMDESFEKITRLAKKIFDVPIVAITLVDKDRQWFKSIEGIDAKELPREISFCTHTILQDAPLVVNNALEDQRFAENPMVTGDPGIRFYAGCPIRLDNEFNIGSLCVVDVKPRSLTPFQVSFLRDLTGLVESELENYRLINKSTLHASQFDSSLRKDAVDELTGLWNRKGFYKLVEERQKECLSTDCGFAIAIFNIDKFKEIIACHDEDFSNRVIKIVAKSLTASIRKTDVIAHWGQERFAALISCDTAADCEKVFARIQENIKHCGSTLTIGVAMSQPRQFRSIEEMIRSAESNLYRGKQLGENQVVYEL